MVNCIYENGFCMNICYLFFSPRSPLLWAPGEKKK